jgi:hypothetical protein
MLRYALQESPLTLAEGIAEYRAANPGLADLRSMSPEAQAFFRSHDVAHVVFGCSTDLDDEAVVKLSSIFGTSAGIGVLRGYRLHESVEIYKRLPAREVLGSIGRSIVLVPRTVHRCLRQRSRWPWTDFERFLEVTLCEIREQFGIRVAHPVRPDHGDLTPPADRKIVGQETPQGRWFAQRPAEKLRRTRVQRLALQDREWSGRHSSQQEAGEERACRHPGEAVATARAGRSGPLR